MVPSGRPEPVTQASAFGKRLLLLAVLLLAVLLLALTSCKPFQDKDCGDFPTWRAAQNFYLSEGGPGKDKHHLDADRDGIACESLPGAPRR